MPGFDGTGPMGRGPKTGKGCGPCGTGLGWGRKFNTGRGTGKYFPWNWTQNKNEQKQALSEYRKTLEEELEDVKKEEQKTK